MAKSIKAAGKVTKGKAKADKARAKAAAHKAGKGKVAKVTKATPHREAAPRVDKFGTTLTGGMKWGTGLDIDESAIITHVADNTKRGAARERYAKYRAGRTVGATLAIDGGPNRDDIRWDAGKGLITLGKGKPSKAKGGKGKAA
jgi:hypothetical protein